jgi:aerobic-type carbon monoxide dehydrogenase small subunit (CoxS/CutS family)
VITLIVNGKTQQLDVPPDMPLLWAIRETWRWRAPSSAAVSLSAAPARCTKPDMLKRA